MQLFLGYVSLTASIKALLADRLFSFCREKKKTTKKKKKKKIGNYYLDVVSIASSTSNGK